MKLHFDLAGLVSIGHADGDKGWYLHLFCKPKHWIWGRETEPYDMCLEYFGLGPLFLLVWIP